MGSSTRRRSFEGREVGDDETWKREGVRENSFNQKGMRIQHLLPSGDLAIEGLELGVQSIALRHS
jgi:hypothetical protein